MLDTLIAHIKGYWSPEEKNIFQAIKAAYIKAIDEKKWPFMKFLEPLGIGQENMQDSKLTTDFKFEQLKIDSWNIQLGRGPLRQYVEEHVALITNYQIARYRSIAQKLDRTLLWTDTLNDPLSLVFEELKNWLMSRLSVANIDDPAEAADLLSEITQRMTYLNLLIGNEKIVVFNETKYNEMTTAGVLETLRINLQKLYLPKTRNHRARASAREYFISLEYALERSLRLGVAFLFYVFRDTANLESNFSFSEIRAPVFPGSQEAIKTLSGKLLLFLVNTPQFINIFPSSDWKNLLTIEPKKMVELVRQSEEAFSYENIFISETGLKIPGTLGNIKTWVKEANSGFLENFRTDATAENYLIFLSLLQHLAFAITIIKQATELAGIGGNILLYGIEAQYTAQLVDTSIGIINSLNERHSYFLEQLNNHRSVLIFNNSEAKQKAEHWFKHNSRLAGQISTELETELKQAEFLLYHISSAVREVNIEDRLRELAVKTSLYQKNVLMFSNLSKSVIEGQNMSVKKLFRNTLIHYDKLIKEPKEPIERVFEEGKYEQVIEIYSKLSKVEQENKSNVYPYIIALLRSKPKNNIHLIETQLNKLKQEEPENDTYKLGLVEFYIYRTDRPKARELLKNVKNKQTIEYERLDKLVTSDNSYGEPPKKPTMPENANRN